MKLIAQPGYNPNCRDCPRLAGFLDRVGKEHPEYHARPVAPFGLLRSKLLVVGLAPGMHGANRTGRPFTGDYAGVLLYGTLHKFGFANHGGSDRTDDGLRLIGCRITDDGIDALARLEQLRELYLSKTEVSPLAAGRLRRKLPMCRVEQ